VSPVFRHGRLRLYLLKLLDESPRHGYEVIRLLQDRFMGVYAPSPGTIYPRLARLEEDGLVTHEEVDGKKVYSITDKGREEIRSRLGDLADLEDELTESLRDVAREISVDVRDTVRSIREELASAAREFRLQDNGVANGGKSGTPGSAGAPGESGADRSDDAQRIREEARRTREKMRADFRAKSRGRNDWAGWSAWSEWTSGKDWAGATDWMTGNDRAGRRGSAGQDASGGRGQTREGAGQKARRGGPGPFTDLERIAIQFANELRAAAKQTGNLGERSLNDLRDILTDTLAKVREEVFSDTGSAGKSSEGQPDPGSAGEGAQAKSAASGSADAGASGPQSPAADRARQADHTQADHTQADDSQADDKAAPDQADETG
jgi:DNA-binding PadR family transcriptional regulator